MNNIFLSNEIIILLFSQTIIYILLTISFFLSIRIIRNWDFSKSSSLQYSLEKISYLVILIISFALFTKIAIFYYFIFSIDSLSFLVPGAMCAAGIFGSNDYGELNLTLKLFNLFFVGIWLILNYLDLKEKDYKYTKTKYILYIFIFILFSMEFILDFLFLNNIPIEEIISCCSIIFGINSISSHLPFNLSVSSLIVIFYLLYVLIVFLGFQKKSFLLMIVSTLFMYISYFSVTYFFSTYIYELPTHKCPFCMLQKEYGFIGYFVWTNLFLGIFFGISSYILKLVLNKEQDFTFKLSMVFNTIFVVLVSFYVCRYYFVNGVFL